MAITKERLEELIEQGATIYDLFKGDIYLIDLTKAKYWKDVSYIEYFNQYYKCNITRNNNDLFETKEDALWELEMTATRTETLKMPKWEEMTTENNEYNYYGSSDTHYFYFDNYRLIVSLEEDCEYIGIDVCGNTELHHWEDVTKENYIEACKLCLKLFKGEKEDE